jgi:hypothetical protein
MSALPLQYPKPIGQEALEQAKRILDFFRERNLDINDVLKKSSEEKLALMSEIPVIGDTKEAIEHAAVMKNEINKKESFFSWGGVKKRAASIWKKYKTPIIIGGIGLAALVGYGFYSGYIPKAYAAAKAYIGATGWFKGLSSKFSSIWGGAGEVATNVGDSVGSAAEAVTDVLPNAGEVIEGVQLPDWNSPVPDAEFDALSRGMDLGQ